MQALNKAEGGGHQIVFGEVISINSNNSNKGNFQGIEVRVLSSGTQQTMTARPFDASNKVCPAIGEIVALTFAPASWAAANRPSSDCYYLGVVNVQGIPGFNGIPLLTKRVENGITDPASETFPILRSSPIKLIEGDNIIEGRNGSGIKLGTTQSKSFVKNDKKGIPYIHLIVSDPKQSENIYEDFVSDDGSTHLIATSNPNTEFKSAIPSPIAPNGAYDKVKGATLYGKSNTAVIQGTDEAALTGGLTYVQSEDGTDISAKNGDVTLDADDILLGRNATESAVLGDIFVRLLQELITAMGQLTVICAPPGSISGPLIASPAWATIAAKLQLLQTALSSQVKVSKVRIPALPDTNQAANIQTSTQEMNEAKAEAQDLQNKGDLEGASTAVEYAERMEGQVATGETYSSDDLPATDDTGNADDSDDFFDDEPTSQTYTPQSVVSSNNNGTGSSNALESPSSSAIVTQARNTLGVKENPSRSNYGPVINDMVRTAGLNNEAKYKNSGSGYFWCASAVTYWWKKAGKSTPNGGAASCSTWFSWAKATKRYSNRPVVGAAVLYKFQGSSRPNHIGIVESISENGTIYTIEGNTSGSGEERNGGGVHRKKCSTKYVVGFVHPDPIV